MLAAVSCPLALHCEIVQSVCSVYVMCWSSFIIFCNVLAVRKLICMEWYGAGGLGFNFSGFSVHFDRLSICFVLVLRRVLFDPLTIHGRFVDPAAKKAFKIRLGGLICMQCTDIYVQVLYGSCYWCSFGEVKSETFVILKGASSHNLKYRFKNVKVNLNHKLLILITAEEV